MLCDCGDHVKIIHLEMLLVWHFHQVTVQLVHVAQQHATDLPN